ncbi:DUF2963 domain-containing protein ['Fragaria x ananassa' phyllody phytoplasma]|uniref:DUF2963 domain-containing protein n=2 Tax='Fragaria x ananassa' phyllody phytoplasma TaxID=2358428 RepID=A0ABS5K3J9_9MOLU|nr:DUF2963 domain-containing protein ['Fragaria x ananassa' phyllody phytoplasma]
MKIDNQKKSKNIIFIVWGLFITGTILFLLIILLLAINKNQTKTENPNQQEQETVENQSNIPSPEEQAKTYNAIMAKVDKEIDVLTTTKNVIFQPDGKTIKYIDEYDKNTGFIIKTTKYQNDGETIEYIDECDKNTGFIIKSTRYQDDGKTISHIEDARQNRLIYE